MLKNFKKFQIGFSENFEKTFFFENFEKKIFFVIFKMLYFFQKLICFLILYTGSTLDVCLEISRWNFYENQHLLFYSDFTKISRFLGFYEGHIFSFVGLGNRQTTFKFLKTSRKVFGDIFSYPKERNIIKNE